MKKISPVLNVVLLLAVIVLYVLHFVAPKPTQSKTNPGDTLSMAKATEGIVYINIDTVMANYTMYDNVMGDLEQKIKTSEAQVESKQRSLQKNYEDAQYKVQRGLVTRSEQQQLEQKLAAQQQELMTLQNKLQYDLAEEQQVAYRKILNSIIVYLKKMESEGKHQFVLGHSFGGTILYANENLNITKNVIEGLNAEYQQSEE